ncbi:hypothetical protein CPB86DRAFT_186843 [Serendipita vermifera]|nr:hypothetical protein CPB86DRAFT_186843 [Serendipita vermifera]
MLRKSENIIKNAKKDPKAATILRESFGPNWQQHHATLRKDVRKMRKGIVPIYDTSAEKSKEFLVGTPYATGHAAVTVRNKKDQPFVVLDPSWHEQNPTNQAGIIVHEASHALLKTGDSAAAKNGKVQLITNEEMQDRVNKGQHISEGVGYMRASATDVINGGARVADQRFKDTIHFVDNPHRNADSWHMLAALGQKEAIIDKPRNQHIAIGKQAAKEARRRSHRQRTEANARRGQRLKLRLD